jgi:hypothetical protein
MELLPESTEAASEAWLLTRITKAELDTVVRGVGEVARLLCDFGALRAALEADAGFLTEDRVVLSVFEVLPGLGLLEKLDATSYRFRIDQYGIGIAVSGETESAGNVPAPDRAVIEDLLAYLSAFVDALGAIGIDPGDLVRGNALPATLNWPEIWAASKRLQAALSADGKSDAVEADVQLVRGFRAVILQRSQPLSLGLLLADYIRHRAEVLHATMPDNARAAPDMAGTLSAFARHIGVAWNSMAVRETQPDPALGGLLAELLQRVDLLPAFSVNLDDTVSIVRWQAALVNPLVSSGHAASKGGFDTQTAWNSWIDPVVATILGPSVTRRKPRIQDLLGAAAGCLPSRLFRRDLSDFQPWEWTMLALEGAMTAAGATQETTPLWALLAGLRALGVDGGKLTDLHSLFADLPASIASPAPVLVRLLEGAPDAKTAILNVARDIALAEAVAGTDSPVLWISEDSVQRYGPALSWLESNGVFAEVRYEQ